MKKLTAMPHQGRNVKRLREMLGIKQDALAIDLGLSQQAVSALEQKEELDTEVLETVAKVLNVPVEAIKNFSEEAIFNIISNTYNNTSNENSTLIASALNYQPTFNTVEKIVELYERILQSEREKVEMLQKFLDKK